MFHRCREGALHDLFGKRLGQSKVAFFFLLADLEIPEVIVDDVGVEHIGAHVERVMRFDPFEDIRSSVLGDLPRQQHPAGLSADHSGSDHPGVNLKIILGPEILFDKLPHLLIPGKHDVADPRTLLRHIDPVLKFDFCALKEALPAVHVLVFRFSVRKVHLPVIAAHLNAFRQGPEFAGGPGIVMGMKHRRGTSLPYLKRPDIQLLHSPASGIRKHIQKQLGCILNLFNRLPGVKTS